MKQLTPFHDEQGNVHFPYRALRSVVFIFPTAPPETLGEKSLIALPEEFREYYQDKTGIILSIGPGYYDKKNRWNPADPRLKSGTKVFFDNSVPHEIHVLGQDMKPYRVVLCMEVDIFGIVEEE